MCRLVDDDEELRQSSLRDGDAHDSIERGDVASVARHNDIDECESMVDEGAVGNARRTLAKEVVRVFDRLGEKFVAPPIEVLLLIPCLTVTTDAVRQLHMVEYVRRVPSAVDLEQEGVGILVDERVREHLREDVEVCAVQHREGRKPRTREIVEGDATESERKGIGLHRVETSVLLDEGAVNLCEPVRSVQLDIVADEEEVGALCRKKKGMNKCELSILSCPFVGNFPFPLAVLQCLDSPSTSLCACVASPFQSAQIRPGGRSKMRR